LVFQPSPFSSPRFHLGCISPLTYRLFFADYTSSLAEPDIVTFSRYSGSLVLLCLCSAGVMFTVLTTSTFFSRHYAAIFILGSEVFPIFSFSVLSYLCSIARLTLLLFFSRSAPTVPLRPSFCPTAFKIFLTPLPPGTRVTVPRLFLPCLTPQAQVPFLPFKSFPI